MKIILVVCPLAGRSARQFPIARHDLKPATVEQAVLHMMPQPGFVPECHGPLFGGISILAPEPLNQAFFT